MGKRLPTLPVVLDKEIKDRDRDRFGHSHLSVALKYLIESDKYTPPFSIGLLGGWGTGKSSIKELYLTSLTNDEERDTNGQARKQKIKTISFNAWRYGGENMRRSLLYEAYRGLEGKEKDFFDSLFKINTEEEVDKKNFIDSCKEAFGSKFLFPIAQALIVFFLVYLLFYLILLLMDIKDNVYKSAFVLLLPIAIYPLLNFLFDPKRYLVSLFNKVTKQDLPISTALQYERLFIKQLDEYRKSKQGKYVQRIVIFVDDLDRLSAGEMIDGLDAIRAFMEMKLPEGIGIVFVISCDEDRVAKALDERRNKLGKDAMPGAVFDKKDARNFLDRLFQFRLEIPKPPQEDMREYARKRFEEDLKEITESVKTHGATLEELVSRLIHVNVLSPRNAIQLINAFSEAWWLALEREFEGEGSQKVGALISGAVTNHPLTLAAVCVFKVDFPDFYCDLQVHPDLISHFIDVVFNEERIDDKPRSIQNALAKYLTRKRGDSTDGIEVEQGHEKLRTFMSSLQTLEMAEDIAPLVLFSQDPISRNLPGTSILSYRYLKAGDVNGFLGELGFSHDEKIIGEDKLDLIARFIENLQFEPDHERIAAYDVLIQIANRLPESANQIIMKQIVRGLADHRSLRELTGLDHITNVWMRGRERDQKLLATHLVDDFCRDDGSVDFKLPRGVTPTFDQCFEATIKAVSIILDIRNKTGLDSRTDSKLLDWLETRPLKQEDTEIVIPFAKLEEWLDTYQDRLLKSMGERYPRVALKQISDGSLEGLDIKAILNRCAVVFKHLFDTGNREMLWSQLAEFIGQPKAPVLDFAYNVINEYKFDIDGNNLNILTNKICDELTLEVSNLDANPEESIGYNIEKPLEILQGIISSRNKELNSAVLKNGGHVAIELPYYKNTTNQATPLIDNLYSVDPVAVEHTISNWINNLFRNLPKPCIAWLSSKVGSQFNEKQFNEISSKLSQIYSRDNITPEEGQTLTYFFSQLPDKDLHTKRIRTLADELIKNVHEKHSNQNNCLERLFPAVPFVLRSATPDEVGVMLQGLFTKVANVPPLLGFLHGQMIGHWPKSNETMPNYNPSDLASKALEVADQSPSEEWAANILKSVASMAQGDVIHEFNKPITQALLKTWPHFNQIVAEVINSLKIELNAINLGVLLGHVDPNSEDNWNDLKLIMGIQASLKKQKQRLKVFYQILANGQANDDVKRKGLSLWLDLAGEDDRILLDDALKSKEINETQRKLVWEQVEKRAGRLGVEFFIATGPEAIKLNELELFSSNYFDVLNNQWDAINEEGKASIIKSHVKAFPSISSGVIKTQLLEWVKRHNGESHLKLLKGNELLSQDDLDRIHQTFPNYKF